MKGKNLFRYKGMVLLVTPSDSDNCNKCPCGDYCSDLPLHCSCMFYEELEGPDDYDMEGSETACKLTRLKVRII